MDLHHDAPTESIEGGSSLSTTRKNASAQSQPVRIRRGNSLLSFLLFLLGVMLGILATLFFALFVIRDRTPIQTPVSTQPSSLTVQISSNYLTQLVSEKLKTSGMTGDITDVRVTLTTDNRIQISGNDRFNLLVVSVTRPFTLTLQPYIQSCQPRVRLLHADLANIPVTNFVTNYEDQINHEIQFTSSNNLPSGFTYCAVNVHTQPDALNIMYSARPT